MKTLADISDLKDKKVLLRVDFDVPVEHHEIKESFRIKKQKETLDYLVSKGAKVVMIAHISALESFGELIPQLHLLLGQELGFIKSVEEISGYLEHYPGPGLLENIRSFSGETENSDELAKKLAGGFDYYINNAFAVCHRNHASVSAVTKFLPSYAGFLVKEEVVQLKRGMDAPEKGKVIIIGGAKAETKVPVIKNFINKAEFVLTGGVVANDILKEKGQDVGSSVVDVNSKELLAGLDINNPKLFIPKDFIIFDNKILDIGEKTITKYCDSIKTASMIIWNGPMGLFENPSFAMGTNKIGRAVAESNAHKIIGGGDTISAVDKIGLLGKFDPSTGSGQAFVSTGGGAMLAFLAGEKLPGLEALDYYE